MGKLIESRRKLSTGHAAIDCPCSLAKQQSDAFTAELTALICRPDVGHGARLAAESLVIGWPATELTTDEMHQEDTLLEGLRAGHVLQWREAAGMPPRGVRRPNGIWVDNTGKELMDQDGGEEWWRRADIW